MLPGVQERLLNQQSNTPGRAPGYAVHMGGEPAGTAVTTTRKLTIKRKR